MFIIKKILTNLFYPLTWIFILFFIGLIFIWLTKRKNLGKLIITFTVLLQLVISYNIFSNKILYNLENKYKPLEDISKLKNIKWIVVLGGGINFSTNLPITSQLNSSTIKRLIEGIRIHKSIKQSKLILSGGKIFNPVSESSIMKLLAKQLNVKEKNIILDDISKDTFEQAKNIKNIVKDDPFILVTSAFHMPRTMLLFNKFDLTPLPSPVGHYIIKTKINTINYRTFFPKISGIKHTQIVIKELLGIMYYKYLKKF